MAKKKSKAKKRGKRRGLVVLSVMLGIIGAFVGAAVLLRPKPDIQASAQVAARFGGAGAAPGLLNSPRGGAVDLAGNIYVVDLGNSRINIYSPAGQFLRSIGKPGVEGQKNAPNEFREPSGVAVDRQGNVFVADSWNGRVVKFDSQGKPLAEYSGPKYGFYSPRNVAVDGAGNFYVADTGNSMVKAYNQAGTLVKEMGGKGKGGGRFEEVFGIAVNSKGEIFIGDPGNRRVHKFSPLPEGKYVKDVKVKGWMDGDRPFWPHVAVDGQDRVYAADHHHRKIWIYDSELNYLGTLGGVPGKEVFGAPLGLAGSGDSLAVVDLGNNQVVKLGQISFPGAGAP